MDFMRFTEDIVEPTSDMLIEMYMKGYIKREHAIALMHQITNIENCMVDEIFGEVHEVINGVIENFTNELGGMIV